MPTSQTGTPTLGTSPTASSNLFTDSRPSTGHGQALEELVDQDIGGVALHYTDMSHIANAEPIPSLQATMEPIPAILEEDNSPPSTSYSSYSLPSSDSTSASMDTQVGVVAPYEQFLETLDRNRFKPVDYLFEESTLCEQPPIITRDHLQGDKCDMQGIDWTLCQTTRAQARAKRIRFEEERLSQELLAVRQDMIDTPRTESYFSFKQMNTRHRPMVPHFQLRNLMAAPNRDNIFYATEDKVLRTDARGGPATVAIDLGKQRIQLAPVQVTTLAASEEVLIAGGFEGEYALRSVAGGDNARLTTGRIKRFPGNKSHIMNHIHLCQSRTNYAPQAILCSNDNRLSTLDCSTNTFTQSFEFSQAVNCTATSPCGRMRVVVGDMRETYIINTETGQPFETLKAHTDDAFACDWADDGIHVATAAQDSTIVVYDARNWSQPLKTMYSELSIPRCLKFSPIGGGPRVLVSAEADDYLNVINAQTFGSKQVFDFFGRMAGISMTRDGSSLFLANSDDYFGGIVELERCGWGEARRGHDARKMNNSSRSGQDDSGYEWGSAVDWDSESALSDDGRVVAGRAERRRRGLDLAALAI